MLGIVPDTRILLTKCELVLFPHVCEDTNVECGDSRDKLLKGLHAGGGQEGAELWGGTL